MEFIFFESHHFIKKGKSNLLFIFLKMKIYYFYLIMLLIVNSFDESLSVDYNLCENKLKIRPNFAEIFGQKWENEKMKEENENIQNSNWQSDQNENCHQNDLGFAHSFGNAQKREIIHKFHQIKEGVKRNGKFSEKNSCKIEQKIAEKLGISRKKIYKWKKEFGLTQKKKRNKKNYYEIKKREFIERFDEFKRMSNYGKQKQLAKELGIGKETFIKWKKEFGIEMNKNGNRFSNEEKICKMNIYEEIKKANPSLTDKDIAEFLKISPRSLSKWKTKN